MNFATDTILAVEGDVAAALGLVRRATATTAGIAMLREAAILLDRSAALLRQSLDESEVDARERNRAGAAA